MHIDLKLPAFTLPLTIRAAAFAGAIFTLGACTARSELHVPIERVSGEQYKVVWVHAYEGTREVRIWGLIRRVGYPSAHQHIHVEARSNDGGVLATVDARLPAMGVRRRSSSFGATLKIADPGKISAINVEVRNGKGE